MQRRITADRVARVDETVRKIVEVARAGRIGDGKIMVLPADQADIPIDV